MPSTSTSTLAPRPLRSLAARLHASAAMHRQWCAYLPQRLQQQPEVCAAAAAAVPALVDSMRSLPLGSEAFCADDSPVAGQVWELSQDPAGCRRVQRALEIAASEEERCDLARELHGHAFKAMRCPHGNHVLQMCIKTMQPESLQFIVDALEGSVVQAAKHKYACRIIQRLLTACPQSQISKIVDGLLEEASMLACHTFGNYTVKQLMMSGTAEHRYELARCIERNAASETAIKHAALEDEVWIARAIIQDPEVLLAFTRRRRGRSCALSVLETLPAERRDYAGLVQCLESLRAPCLESQVAQKVKEEQ